MSDLRELQKARREAERAAAKLAEIELRLHQAAAPSPDGRSVRLTVEGLQPTQGMEIKYSLRSTEGRPVENVIHNTIHRLGKDEGRRTRDETKSERR